MLLDANGCAQPKNIFDADAKNSGVTRFPIHYPSMKEHSSALSLPNIWSEPLMADCEVLVTTYVMFNMNVGAVR